MTDPANPSEASKAGPKQPAAIASARHPELPFVTPSPYLHLRAPVARPTASSHSRTDFPLAAEKPLMTPLDKEQMQGLVSLPNLRTEALAPRAPLFLSPSRAPLATEARNSVSWSAAGATSARPLLAALAAGSIQRGSTSSRRP